MELEFDWKSQNLNMIGRILNILNKYSLLELISYALYSGYLLSLQWIGTFFFRLKVIFWNIQIGKSSKVTGKFLFFKYPGSKISIGDNFTSISHSSRAMATSLFSPTCIKTLSDSSEILIGNGVGLNGTSITARSKSIKIGDHVMIAANVTIMDSDFHVVFPPQGRLTNPGYEFDANIEIGENVWIGTRCTILKGVSIGKNSVIAAGSIVSKSIPANVVAGGIPAKVIRALETTKKGSNKK